MRSFYQGSAVPTMMAIVNHTPDSFYDRGVTAVERAASVRVDRVVTTGAGIVDTDGVRVGISAEIAVTEEIEHVVSTIAKVRERYPGLHISVDTWHVEVEKAAIETGANLINDTWAGHDPGLLEVAGAHGMGYICSHTGGTLPRTNPVRVRYNDVVDDVISETGKLARRAVDTGVPEDRILIGPTHNLDKNTYHGLELLRRYNELVATGWPALMALSNKDFVGEILDRPVEQRVPGTLAATAHTAAADVAVFRSHQVSETLDACHMTLAIFGDFASPHPMRGLV